MTPGGAKGEYSASAPMRALSTSAERRSEDGTVAEFYALPARAASC